MKKASAFILPTVIRMATTKRCSQSVQGLSEKFFYLATKVKAAGMDREGKPSSESTAEDFLSKFNTSLSRLKMDYVDILYIHEISNPEYLEYKPIVNAVKKLKKDGKIKFMGFSTHRNEAAVIDAAASMEDWDVILTSYNLSRNTGRSLTLQSKKLQAPD
jgi:predicted aldo/keto reductase-like oxidoreductase